MHDFFADFHHEFRFLFDFFKFFDIFPSFRSLPPGLSKKTFTPLPNIPNRHGLWRVVVSSCDERNAEENQQKKTNLTQSVEQLGCDGRTKASPVTQRPPQASATAHSSSNIGE